VRRPRILFRIAAGPRIGFGHLVRASRLASALDARAWASVQGRRYAVVGGTGLPAVDGGVRLLDCLQPDALILDTPVSADGSRWAAAARRRDIPVISVHDAGIAPVASDLAVDGSVAARGPIRGARRTLYGPRYAMIDPRASRRRAAVRHTSRRIIVALGGGARASVADRISSAVAARFPQAEIAVAGGFLAGLRISAAPNVHWLGPQDGLAHLLAAADVAVVAGGVTLYECGAAGVAAVPVAVVSAQVPAIRAFARAGAALDPRVTLAGTAIDSRGIARVVRAVAALLDDMQRRDAMALAGSRLVDGRGVERVAAQVTRVIARDRRTA
jgi:spore coat polysaccharide biosynthesis predicted glycosyltransferase SpsG